MVEIEQRVIISYAGGCQVQVPEKLLVSHAGQKYLKLLGSHHGICRLVSGPNLETYKKASNPSLAGSPALKQLKSQVQDAIRNEAQKQSGVFAGLEDDGDGNHENPNNRAKVAPPPSVDIDVDGQKVTCLTPSGKISELCVLLDKDMLGAVFSAIHKDINECFAAEKRSYKKKDA